MLRLSLLISALMALTVAAQSQIVTVEQPRLGLRNVFTRLKLEHKAVIAYLGGSITAGAGSSESAKTSWRALTTAWFKAQYPHADITEVDASIGGTGSVLGAFRLQREVLDKNPDLVFVEFAVNDLDAPAETIDRAMEGIVRQIRSHDLNTEICFVYTLHQDMLKDYKADRFPPAVFEHEVIAQHYGLPSINLGAATAERINAGQWPWASFSKDNCHPTDAGYQFYADLLTAFLARQSLNTSTYLRDYRLSAPKRKDSWNNARLIEAASLALPSGWRTEEKSFRHDWPRAIASNTPGALLNADFQGDTIGIYYILGPDTGNLDYKIDAGVWQEFRPFDPWAASGARPQYRLLADHLAPGSHTLTLRLRADADDHSKGTWTRLAFLMTNDRQ